jgi:hypothetical protein
MVAAGLQDQLVQLLEIIVIAREDNPALANGIREVDRVFPARGACLGGRDHIMPFAGQ